MPAAFGGGLASLLVIAASLSAVSPAGGNGGHVSQLGTGEVVFTILSHGGAYHSARAREKQQQWRHRLASSSTDQGGPPVLLAHELPLQGAMWTIIPLLSYLSEHHHSAKWYFFAEEETEVDFNKLESVLDNYSHNEVWFLGHSLVDQTQTILHHYANHEGDRAVHYPNFPSGWLLSAPALHRAAEHAQNFIPTFNIDPQYELALFLKYMRTPQLDELHPGPLPPPAHGYTLSHVPQLCMQAELGEQCASAYSQDIPPCGSVGASKIFFGVKTCSKYHSTRLPVVQQTWGPDAGSGIAYYSEVEDEQFGTTDIGVPNTERGHCGKMMAIIHKFQSSPELKERAWLVIADDDTILSVPRLCLLLGCYDPQQPILLGEVYGFNAETEEGYSYVTGGGGMVLSRKAVEMIVKSGYQCPSMSTPDDMFLGNIAKDLNIAVIHSPLFHQAQPSSFHPAILGLQTHISFHRHHPSDPYQLYSEYLVDSRLPDNTQSTSFKKTEL